MPPPRLVTLLADTICWSRKAAGSMKRCSGTFDQNTLQRGYKVYSTVCSTCHGMKLLSFRNLGEQGGPFYDAKYPNPNDQPGREAARIDLPGTRYRQSIRSRVIPIMAPPKTSDRILGPFANDTAARAANGAALPPDLSVIAKARHGGAGYIYSLLNGYGEPPAGLNVNQGRHYNEYFPAIPAASGAETRVTSRRAASWRWLRRWSSLKLHSTTGRRPT